MKNAKNLLDNCIKCGCDIQCSVEKRNKRSLSNYCYSCYRSYMNNYTKNNNYTLQKKYLKSDKGKEYLKNNYTKIAAKQKESKRIAKEKYMNSKQYIIDKENKRLYTYISKKRIGLIKGANKRGIFFDKEITTDYLYKKCEDINRECSISGIKMYCGSDTKYNTLSVDRIDSSKGYTKDNIQIVCYMYNVMKSTFTDNECIEFAKKIVSNL